jgi:RimJ/RimL family protein N-acetyltransferase
MIWPAAERVDTARFVLEPLAVDHAAAMVGVLAEPSLYRFTGGEAPTLEQLTRRYVLQTHGQSKDGSEGWLNWVIGSRSSDELLGFVQSTVRRDAGGMSADVAWLVTPKAQGQGAATEAARAMVAWLRLHEVTTFTAYIHPEHHASMAVAAKLGLVPTDKIKDGEICWESIPASGSA